MKDKGLIACGALLLVLLCGCVGTERDASDQSGSAVNYKKIEIPPEGIFLERHKGLPAPHACTADFCREDKGAAE